MPCKRIKLTAGTALDRIDAKESRRKKYRTGGRRASSLPPSKRKRQMPTRDRRDLLHALARMSDSAYEAPLDYAIVLSVMNRLKVETTWRREAQNIPLLPQAVEPPQLALAAHITDTLRRVENLVAWLEFCVRSDHDSGDMKLYTQVLGCIFGILAGRTKRRTATTAKARLVDPAVTPSTPGGTAKFSCAGNNTIGETIGMICILQRWMWIYYRLPLVPVKFDPCNMTNSCNMGAPFNIDVAGRVIENYKDAVTNGMFPAMRFSFKNSDTLDGSASFFRTGFVVGVGQHQICDVLKTAAFREQVFVHVRKITEAAELLQASFTGYIP